VVKRSGLRSTLRWALYGVGSKVLAGVDLGDGDEVQ
jgi:hypothetical protein